MSLIFDYFGENPSFTHSALALGSIKELKEKCSHQEFVEVEMYLYYVCDRESIYSIMLPSERREIVCSDKLKRPKDYWQKLEKKFDLEKVMKDLDALQYTPAERLCAGVDRKIEEYLIFWDSIKVNEKNHNIVAESLLNAAKLVKLKEELTKQVYKDKEDTRQVGGGRSKLFEE